MQQPELWIGLVELKPLDPKSYGAAGAFTNILTWACDIEGSHKNADTIAATLDVFVTDVGEAEPLAERIRTSALTQEVEEMLQRAESNPNAIVYGTFHRYPFDEA